MTAQIHNKMETLQPCSSTPQKATRMKRARQLTVGAGATQTAALQTRLDRRQLCEEMIQSGFVQSFVDFFYLTHRPDPSAMEQQLSVMDYKGCVPLGQQTEPNAVASPTISDVKQIQVPSAEMALIRDNLIRAEMARRKGDTAKVYESFSCLAQYFQHRSGDAKTGVYFCEKCLEIAGLTGDFRGELKANYDLGLAHSLIGDFDGAIRYHERHLEMARSLEDEAEILVALNKLIQVYRAAAKQREAEGDLKAASQLHERCLEAARNAEDTASEATAALALGKSLIDRGEDNVDEAIQTLEVAEILCRKLHNEQGEGQACSALASAWRLQGDDDRACDYLYRYLDLADSTGDLHAQAGACRTLGAFHSARGEFARAVDLLKRNFHIARKLLAAGETDTKLVDRARVHLGIALGNASIGQYLHAIKEDFPALLAWRNSRESLSSDVPIA